jgi:hypothetical protein
MRNLQLLYFLSVSALVWVWRGLLLSNPVSCEIHVHARLDSAHYSPPDDQTCDSHSEQQDHFESAFGDSHSCLTEKLVWPICYRYAHRWDVSTTDKWSELKHSVCWQFKLSLNGLLITFFNHSRKRETLVKVVSDNTRSEEQNGFVSVCVGLTIQKTLSELTSFRRIGNLIATQWISETDAHSCASTLTTWWIVDESQPGFAECLRQDFQFRLYCHQTEFCFFDLCQTL